jgi:hypothetical protein
MSAFGGKADVTFCGARVCFLTQGGPCMVDHHERLVSISFSKPAAFDVDQSSLELIGQNADNWSGAFC